MITTTGADAVIDEIRRAMAGTDILLRTMQFDRKDKKEQVLVELTLRAEKQDVVMSLIARLQATPPPRAAAKARSAAQRAPMPAMARSWASPARASKAGSSVRRVPSAAALSATDPVGLPGAHNLAQVAHRGSEGARGAGTLRSTHLMRRPTFPVGTKRQHAPWL